jgi:predicted RNA-binding Zn-ribbon protein involved in translation (DUF1610 family)
MKPIKYPEKRKAIEKDLKQKMMLFDRIPDHCVSCEKSFDKTDVDMVVSWTVVVRNEQDSVNLYCPECIEKAKTIISDFKKKQDESKV